MKSRFACLVAALSVLSGCENRLPTVPVKAVLKINDKPFGPAALTFAPNPAEESRPAVKGVVDASGNVTIGTYKDSDGAPIGSYDVTLLPDVMTLTPVPITEPYKLEIKSGDSEIVIALKSKGKDLVISPMPSVNSANSTALPTTTLPTTGTPGRN